MGGATVPAHVSHAQEAVKAIENSLGMKLVWIPAGEFEMGSNESDDEKPVHRVRITKPFWLGQTEVTLGQFLEFYNDGYKGKLDCEQDGKGAYGYDAATGEFVLKPAYRPWSWGHPDMDIATEAGKRTAFRHPVVNVSWNDAVAFCEWLSRKEGKQYRLPTEAEWEYACRAGTTTRYWTGDDPESLAASENIADGTLAAQFSQFKDLAIRSRDGHVFTAPVGSFGRVNPFGLADMQGNVAEWCSDWYDAEYYANSPAADPKGPSSAGSLRVVRGGSWYSSPVVCRSALRLFGAPSYRGYDVGFRVVPSVE
jgi:sulfatase modifying factor 1